MNLVRAAIRLFAVGLVGVFLSSCESPPGPEFAIASGSENQALEPIVQEFCKTKRATCTVSYLGSLDIGLNLRPGQDPKVDAVWPASSIWINMFDTGRRVSHLQSISQNPVVLGVRKSKAQSLGWIGKQVSMQDILAAVDANQLRFLMTSATQSNSGASAYLAMLTAAVGKHDLLSKDDLRGSAIDQVSRLLRGVERSAGSSGWLADLYVDSATKGLLYDAMWNYEAVIKETNDKLRLQGREPLWAVYPSEGVATADSPLGFVERGRGKDVETFFTELQQYLLSPEIQERIAKTGRRVPLGRAPQAPAEPDWNFDPNKMVTAAPIPEPQVIRAALVLYQEALRRPSLSAFCLDFSGSMKGEGESQLRGAMQFLFTPDQASEVLIQWSPRDHIIVMPFNSAVEATWEAAGSADEQAGVLAKLVQMHADGGTNMYACVEEALRRMQPLLSGQDFLPALIIMTDGRSEGDPNAFLSGSAARDRRIPIFGITFGDADRSQLDALAAATGARVFDGTKDLVGAFRSVRGYN